MIHRLQRCRGPRGPRASVTPAHRNSPRFAKKHGSRRHSWGGRLPPFLRRGSHKCGSPQRHQSQRGSLPGMEGCVCRKLPPWPPHHPSFGGVGDLDLLHFLHILSGGGWGRPAYPCIHASAGGSRGAPFVWGARAWIGFPIQSGPPRLAPWPSACSPCSLQPSVPHPLFHLFVPPPLSLSAVALFFVSPDPPPFCSPWPCPHPNTHPNTPQQCPAPHRGLPPGRQPDIHRDSPPPGLYLDL